MYDIRHNARIKARNMMQNADEVAGLRARDLKKYGNPDGPTFDQRVEKFRKEGLEGDDIYESIIGTVNKIDNSCNARFGVKK